MLGVALSATILAADPIEGERFLASVRELRVPHVVIERNDTPLADIVAALGLPARAIHYIDTDETRLQAARAFGMHSTATLSESFEMLAESYTRSALNLRYMFRSVLKWRPGHFKS